MCNYTAEGSPGDPIAPETGLPGDTSQTGLSGQTEDSEQTPEPIHEGVGSPVETREEESSQYPSTQQLFGADSS